MKIEHITVAGFEAAFRGMRNPMDSWDRSDSVANSPINAHGFWIGGKDMELACKLINAGSEHRKFLRQIMIWVDLTLPRYVWTELDTYKVGTVRNSCSTMHKLGSRPLTQQDFELPISYPCLQNLNDLGEELRESKKGFNLKTIRRSLKNALPEGYLQKATYMMSYETALSIYFQRRNHRLPEWRADSKGSICQFIADLPYMWKFINVLSKK